MPHGVWTRAFGIRSETCRISCGCTGAPAESTSRTASSASRWGASSPSAVATTFARAAGEANSTLDCPAIAASASFCAVRVAGWVTSMSGETDAAPRAGPSSANGAKPASRDPPGRMPRVREISATRRPSRSCVYTTPLAGPVEPDVNSTAASASRAGSGSTVPCSSTASPAAGSRWRSTIA